MQSLASFTLASFQHDEAKIVEEINFKIERDFVTIHTVSSEIFELVYDIDISFDKSGALKFGRNQAQIFGDRTTNFSTDKR